MFLRSFRGSGLPTSYIIALPSHPTETIILEGDPSIKSLLSTQYHVAHTWKNQNTTAIEL